MTGYDPTQLATADYYNSIANTAGLLGFELIASTTIDSDEVEFNKPSKYAYVRDTSFILKHQHLAIMVLCGHLETAGLKPQPNPHNLTQHQMVQAAKNMGVEAEFWSQDPAHYSSQWLVQLLVEWTSQTDGTGREMRAKINAETESMYNISPNLRGISRIDDKDRLSIRLQAYVTSPDGQTNERISPRELLTPFSQFAVGMPDVKSGKMRNIQVGHLSHEIWFRWSTGRFMSKLTKSGGLDRLKNVIETFNALSK